MSESADAGALPFRQAVQAKDKPKTIPKVSVEMHMLRAMRSGQPFAYIAKRSGRCEYEGEQGISHIAAIEMYLALSVKKRFASPYEIAEVRRDPAFIAALSKVPYEMLPQIYTDFAGLYGIHAPEPARL